MKPGLLAILLFFVSSCSSIATSNAPPSPPAVDATRGSDPSDTEVLRISTNSVLTDGRHLKIRGRVMNTSKERVIGVRYRVLLGMRGGSRILDSFFEERAETVIEAGGSTALRVDVASTYVGDGAFVVHAMPLRLGAREVPEPTNWRGPYEK